MTFIYFYSILRLKIYEVIQKDRKLSKRIYILYHDSSKKHNGKIVMIFLNKNAKKKEKEKKKNKTNDRTEVANTL